LKLKGSLREKGHPKSNTYLKAKLRREMGRNKRKINRNRKPQNIKRLTLGSTQPSLIDNTILMLKEAMPNRVNTKKMFLCISKDQRGVQEVEPLTTKANKMLPNIRGFSTQINQLLK